MGDQAVSERRTELRRAVIELRGRGLNTPAKWAAEQLTGLPTGDDNDSEPSTSSSSDEEDSDIFLLAKSYFDLKVKVQHAKAVRTGMYTSHCVLAGVPQSCACPEDKCWQQSQILAMLCLVPGRGKAKRVRFLCCCQCWFHVHCVNSGDCRREERVENGGPLGKEDVTNKDIEAVEAELSNARQQGTADAFALYLYGLVLIDKYVCCCRTSNTPADDPCSGSR